MAELDTTVETKPETAEVETVESGNGATNAEIARLKAELEKQKAAFDKASKEAAESKRALRAKQSAEEVAAEEAKALQQSMQEELEQLRREKSVGLITKSIMDFGVDGENAGQIAECFYGAEDAENGIALIKKAWAAKEKALRLEYGKIPAPGVGGADGPTITKSQLDAMNYMDRIEFANKHPEEYEKLMGRN